MGGFSLDISMEVLKLCVILIFCVLQYHAAKIEKREYADCEFWAANGDCDTKPECGSCDWQLWVAANCPVACAKHNADSVAALEKRTVSDPWSMQHMVSLLKLLGFCKVLPR